MTTKLLKGALTRFAVMAIAAVFFTPTAFAAGGSEATGMTNPVTGETEMYVNTFTGGADGTATEWNSADNWDTSKTPFISDADAYSSALVDGKAVSTTTNIDGWNLQVGAYNGASITWNPLGKIQGDSTMWLTVDGTSSITINGWGGGNLGQSGKNLNYYVAAQNGVTWSENLDSGWDQGLTMNYYLAKNGSVSYKTLERCAHVIKAADVTLSGTSRVEPKILVSFTSTTKTFTADAAIKVYGTDGTTLKKTVKLVTVRQAGVAIENATSTLTTGDSVGSCEIVQCTDGIVLYYVDGDPDTIAAYKPSININFTNGAGNGLTTSADVGLDGYAVPGTSWNSFVVVNNTTFNTVNAIDSTGAASAMSGVSVTISGTRGSYSCSGLTSADNPLHGYIDENGTYPTPTVTVSGIPYYKYRVIVYHSTDTAGVPFGYDTINGTNYTYVNDALAEGTTEWGNSGAKDSANAIAEGGNVLVTEALSGSTLTVVGHRAGGVSNARGCIAAIQIIEVKPEAGEGDLIIEVSGATTYTVNEAKTLSGTVYVIGQGTLTLDGSAKISSATIDVGPGVTMNVNADRLDGTTFIGSGTVVYDGSQPLTTKGFDNSSGWVGTVWVKNIGDPSRGEATNLKVNTCLGSNTEDATSNDLNKWGNASSFVKFTNVRGYMATANVPWTLILEDDSSNYAWYNNEGWTARTITIAGLKGNGTFWDVNDGGTRPFLNFTDASQFTGSINATGKQVFLSGAGTGNASGLSAGRITVPENQTLTVVSGKTWHTRNGLVVDGTLNVNGTLASDSTTTAVSGSGTVVFTGRYPTPVDGDSETKWWKNSSWTGTVQIANKSGMAGDCEFNKYGNANSTLELNNVTGWVQNNYECTVPLKITGTLTLNNGSSAGNGFTIDHLKGSGTIYGYSSADKVIIRVKEWADYTGAVQLTNKIVIFGEDTLPTAASNLTAGQIFISSGADVTIRSSGSWWAVNGIVVNGTFTAADRNKWGGGTAVTVNETGVLKLAMTDNIDATGATATDNARYLGNIGGTGTILLSGTKWLGLPKTEDAAFMWASTLAVSNCLTLTSGGLVFTRNTTIGTLSGNGLLRSDLDTAGTGNRVLTILQSADSEWSGTLYKVDKTKQISVAAKQGATAKTLKLSGTQTATKPLVVESATETTDAGSVNLTGTWVGDTTVFGTIGGTGTLTGNLTFNAGSTFKAFASDENGLSVSGSIAYPASGTVTVDVSALGAPAAKVVLLTAVSESYIDLSKFALADVTNRKYKLAKEGATLVVKRIKKKVLVIVK